MLIATSALEGIRMILFTRLVTSLFMLVIISGCSGSASAPSTPAQIPTSIEYAQGDVIVTGQITGFSSSSINSIGKSASSTVDGVYALNTQMVAETATFSDSDGYFYLVIPAGQTYAVALTSGTSIVARVEIPAIGLHTIPLIFVDGASAAGTVSFDSSNLPDSSAVSVVDLGTLQIAASSNLSKASGANFDVATSSSTTVSDQLNLEDIDYTGTLEGFFSPDIDIDQNGIADYTEALYGSYVATPGDWPAIINEIQSSFPDYVLQRLLAKYYLARLGPSSDSAQLVSELSNAFANPGAFCSPDFKFNLTTNVESIMNDSEIYLSAGSVITTTDGHTYAAGEKIPSCSDLNYSYDFFCGNDGMSSIPSTNYYIWLDSDNASETPLKFGEGLDPSITSMTSEIFVPVPKFVVAGDLITLIVIKWQKKVGSTWSDMTDNEVNAVAEKWCDTTCFRNANLEVEIDGGSKPVDQRFMDDDEVSLYQTIVTTPVTFSDITTVYLDYTDISGSVHSFRWLDH